MRRESISYSNLRVSIEHSIFLCRKTTEHLEKFKVLDSAGKSQKAGNILLPLRRSSVSACFR